MTRWFGRTVFWLMGWRIEGEWPNCPKLIVAVAPHTSNVDFILSVAVFWGLELKTHYLAKQSLFCFPLGPIMRALGGIPVDRGSPQGMVEQLREQFAGAGQFVLGITPEGTRGRTREWKSGFARIAAAAQVPVLPAIVNYAEKVVYLQTPITTLNSVDDIVSATQRAASVGSPRNR